MNVVIVFATTHNALAAEVRLKEKKIAFEILPTPREITASCGLSVRIPESSLDSILPDLESSSIKASAIYKVESSASMREKIYTEIWRG